MGNAVGERGSVYDMFNVNVATSRFQGLCSNVASVHSTFKYLKGPKELVGATSANVAS